MGFVFRIPPSLIQPSGCKVLSGSVEVVHCHWTVIGNESQPPGSIAAVRSASDCSEPQSFTSFLPPFKWKPGETTFPHIYVVQKLESWYQRFVCLCWRRKEEVSLQWRSHPRKTSQGLYIDFNVAGSSPTQFFLIVVSNEILFTLFCSQSGWQAPWTTGSSHPLVHEWVKM